MKCPYCGKEIADDAVFCTYCGHTIEDKEKEKKETEEDLKQLKQSAEAFGRLAQRGFRKAVRQGSKAVHDYSHAAKEKLESQEFKDRTEALKHSASEMAGEAKKQVSSAVHKGRKALAEGKRKKQEREEEERRETAMRELDQQIQEMELLKKEKRRKDTAGVRTAEVLFLIGFCVLEVLSLFEENLPAMMIGILGIIVSSVLLVILNRAERKPKKDFKRFAVILPALLLAACACSYGYGIYERKAELREMLAEQEESSESDTEAVPSAESSQSSEAETGIQMISVTGMRLDEAQAALQSAGFSNIVPQTEEGEIQNPSDWTVNAQSVLAGTMTDQNAEIVLSCSAVSTETQAAETDVPVETEEQTAGEVYYYSGSREDAEKGNSGIYAYVAKGSGQDEYTVVNFDEGYLYQFPSNDAAGSKARIVSGDLSENCPVTINIAMDGSTWQELYKFKYVNIPNRLLELDRNGFEIAFEPADLNQVQQMMAQRSFTDISAQ